MHLPERFEQDNAIAIALRDWLQRRRPSVGLIVTEVFRQVDLWLVDEGLEKTLRPGHVIATRFYAPGPLS